MVDNAERRGRGELLELQRILRRIPREVVRLCSMLMDVFAGLAEGTVGQRPVPTSIE